MNLDKILVGIPAYNEEKVIGSVILNLKKEGFKHILVVDDCSNDETGKIAEKNGAISIRHPINRGAGAASASAIEFAKREGYQNLILMDADGQHHPKDAIKLIQNLENYDVIIGSRMINPKGMPIHRIIANKIGSLLTLIFFGAYVKDSQSGFKAMSRRAIEKIEIKFDGFEFSSEFIGEIKRHKLKHKEVPIQVIYTDYSLGKSHGQRIRKGISMILRFVFRI